MNPLVLWIEHHPRAQWSDPALLDRYRQIDPTVTQQQWRSALGQAYARERVQQELQGAFDSDTLGQALFGVMTFGSGVYVRVLVHGRDVAGHTVTLVVDVLMNRNDRMDTLLQAAIDAANQDPSGQGVQIESIDVLPGSYRAD